MPRPLSMLVALAMLGLVACGDDDTPEVIERAEDTTDNEATTTTTTEPEETGGEAVEAYFEALGGETAAEREEMIQYAQEGTPAHSYAVHQTLTARADSNVFVPFDGLDVDVDEDQVRVCGTTFDAQSECTEFAAFEVDPESELLASFTVGGEPLDSLVLGEGDPQEADGITVQRRSAFRAPASDALFVVLDVTDASGRGISPNDQVYVGADGQQAQLTSTYGAFEVTPNATATMVSQFDGATIGGTLRVRTYWLDDFFDGPAFEVPIS